MAENTGKTEGKTNKETVAKRNAIETFMDMPESRFVKAPNTLEAWQRLEAAALYMQILEGMDLEEAADGKANITSIADIASMMRGTAWALQWIVDNVVTDREAYSEWALGASTDALMDFTMAYLAAVGEIGGSAK